MGHIWDSFLRVFLGLVTRYYLWCSSWVYSWALNRFAKGFFDPLVELYRPVPPLAWAPLSILQFLELITLEKYFYYLWYHFLS